MSEGMEFRDSPEQQAVKLLTQFGHLRPGEDLSPTLRDHLRNGVVDSAKLRDLCGIVEAAKEDGGDVLKGLPSEDLHVAIRYGLHDLSGISFHDTVTHENLESFDLSGSNLSGSRFLECDFGNANMERIRLDVPGGDLERPVKEDEMKRAAMDVMGSNLINVQLSTLLISDHELDLTDGMLEVEGTYWDITSNDGWVGSCAGAEMYHKAILGMPDKRSMLDTGYSKYAKRGVILFQEQEPLGILKFKNEASFLPMRTVRNKEGQTIFFKGMLYALAKPLENELKAMSVPYKDATDWRRADVEVLPDITERPFRRDNKRFLYDPLVYGRLTQLREDLRSGREKTIDIASNG